MDARRQSKSAEHSSGVSVEDDHAGIAFFCVREQLLVLWRAQLETMRSSESIRKLEPAALGKVLKVDHGYRCSRCSHLVIGFEQAEVRDVSGMPVGC